MSTSLNPRPQVRSSLLSAIPWINLTPLAQTGLGYLFLSKLISPYLSLLFWLIGTPLCYLLIGLLASFRAGGYRTREHAIERGTFIGLIVGAGGAVLVALVVLLLFPITRSLYSASQVYATNSPFSTSWVSLPFSLDIYIPLLNLFGVAFAALGGLLGGSAATTSISLEPQPKVRSPLRSVAPWIILPPLIQVGLIHYASASASWWPLLAGTPLCYLLIGLLAAFCTGGYRTREHAIERGALIGIIVWVGSVVLIVLAELFLPIWHIYYYRTHQPPIHGRVLGDLGLVLLLYWEGACLLVNLLCLLPVALGGLLGGSVRVMRGRKQLRPS